jgi:hypothetical protein
MCHAEWVILTDLARSFPPFPRVFIYKVVMARRLLILRDLGATMSEGITYLVLSVCVVGGPWLAMAIMTKARRHRIRRGIDRDLANHFPPPAPERRSARRRAQIATKTPAKLAGEKRKRETASITSPVRALLPPGAGALLSQSERSSLPPEGCEAKPFRP